jgi:DNA-binding FadR family transcriptional regulator
MSAGQVYEELARWLGSGEALNVMRGRSLQQLRAALYCVRQTRVAPSNRQAVAEYCREHAAIPAALLAGDPKAAQA